MPESVFDYEAIRTRLDQLDGTARMPARILVVDDDPVTVELLTELFAYEGYVVSTAFDGLEALAKIKSEKPDIISLNVRMPPGIDGFEVCRRIRADTASAHIPVVMLTGQCDVASRMRGLEAGADDFLTKPFRIIELTARIRSLLRQQR
jgi:two-component system, cell cycle response regulator